MSETMSMTAARSAAKKDCGCGCGGSGSDCCEIECLVHPRFFCGQLLADQDLTALVDWVKAKGALARYRHGWGVVCGLDVHCGKGGTVTVSPGYAMDCCGRDIVVCEETPFDLTPCWKRANDPCANGAVTTPPSGDVGGWMYLNLNQGTPADNNLGGFIPKNELQAVDIFIRYAESQSDSRTALARGGCGGAAGCEYTRVQESSEIYCLPADGCNIAADPWKEWEDGYNEGLGKLRRELDGLLQNAEFATTAGRRAAIDRFIAYVARHSPHSFCFIREWLCYLQGTQTEIDPQDDQKQKAAEKVLRATLASIAFWIVQDWRNEYLLKPCRGCGPDTGIHLARVWMWMRRDSRGKENLTTVYVNAYPPFRRMLSNDEWQLPADKVNLGPYVWQPADTAMQSLQRMGVTAVQFPIAPDVTLVGRSEILLANFGSVGTTQSPLTMYTTFDPHCPTQARVVGFVRRDATANAETTPATQSPHDTSPAGTTTTVVAHPVANLIDLPGIGPARAERLRNAGINTVVDLAAAPPAAVRDALGTPTVADSLVEQMIAQAQARM